MLTITIDPTYPTWLRLKFDYNARLVELVKTFPNRRWIPEDREWQVPALDDVFDALCTQYGHVMESIDYDVLVACYPAPQQRNIYAEAERKEARLKRAKYAKRKVTA